MNGTEPLARRVNHILTRYIAVHNEVFPGSLRALYRILGLNKPADFGSLQQRLANLQTEVIAARDTAANLAVIGDLSPAEIAFRASLRRYCDALHETIDLLSSMCVELQKKSRIRSHYTWKQYRKDLKSYQSKVRHYRALGVELNELFESVPQCGHRIHELYAESRASLSRKDYAQAYERTSHALDQIADYSLPAELNGFNYEEQLRSVRMFAAFGHFHGTKAWEMARLDADWIMANAKDKQTRKLASSFTQVDAQRDQISGAILRDLERHPEGEKMAGELRRLGEDVTRDKR